MVLLGRAAEQEAVDRLLASARLGRGGVLSVVGEPGVGKTALLTQAVAGLDDHVRVLWSTGTEIERDLPFAALHTVLRNGLHLLDALPGPQADALACALSLRPGGPQDRFATGAATVSLLSLLAEESPVVVVLDDTQWADLPSVEALVFAARRVHDDPVVVLFGARRDEVPPALLGLPELELGGLDAADSAQLVRQSDGGVTDPDLIARLHDATGGNPLALLELAAVPELVTLRPDEGSGTRLLRSVPDRLRAAFAHQLAPLSEDERAVALVAVVGGGDLRLTRAACARLDLGARALDGLLATRLVSVAASRLAFRHPILRSVVYQSAPAALRRSAHLAVADELTAADEHDLRVWHRAAGSTHLDEELAVQLEGVGRRAVARTALPVASTAFERAARWTPDAGAMRRRLVEAAEAAWDGGQAERALALLEEVLPSAAGDAAATRDPGATRAARLRGVIEVRSGSIREGLVHLEAAAGTAGPEERVRLLAEAVHACLYLADGTAVRRVAEQIPASLEHALSPATRGVGLAACGVAAVILGEDATPRLREALPLLSAHVDPITQPAALPWLMLTPLFLREADAGSQLRRLVDEVRTRVGVGALPNLLFHVARDQATSSAWDRADANYEEAAHLARETGQGTELAMALAGLACLDARAGRAAACRAHATEASELARPRHIRFAQIWCELARGELELSEGRSAQAAERLTLLVTRLDELGVGDANLDPGPDLVDALLRVGEVEAATRAARRYASVAGPDARPWTVARVQRALGLVAPDEACDAPFALALVSHARTRDTFEAARTRLAHGMRLRRAGRRVDARPVLREALSTFEDLGAGLWAESARVELAATGERVPPRAPTGPDSLTPQELQVCLLLADGRTTREAAAALFLSPKTIEYHLRKAYSKLAIHSRQELGEVLADLG